MSSATPSTLQRILEARLTQLAGELQYAFEAELGARLAREIETRIAEEVRAASETSVQRARQAMAGELNQWARRLRQAPDEAEAASVLLEGAALFAAGAAVFRVEDGTARALAVRGVPPERMESARHMAFPLAEAAAFAHAVESRDPVTAMAATQIPQALAEAAGMGGEDKVWLAPMAAQDRVTALLFAWRVVDPAALELLAQFAAARFQPAPTPLVAIAPAPPRAALSAWEDLGPEERRLHLAAQRFARVQAAEMRLHRSDAVREGRSRGELYQTLRGPIDAARETYRKQFMSATPTMVDYLHLEFERTLANNDATLLGNDYPGPLV